MPASSLGLSSFQIAQKTVEMCAVHRRVHVSACFWEKQTEFLDQKMKGTIQTFISEECKSKHRSWYGVAAEQTSWVTGLCVKVPFTWRHILGLHRDLHCHQDDVLHGKSKVIRTRQCQASFSMCYIKVVSWTLYTCSPDLSLIVNV